MNLRGGMQFLHSNLAISAVPVVMMRYDVILLSHHIEHRQNDSHVKIKHFHRKNHFSKQFSTPTEEQFLGHSSNLEAFARKIWPLEWVNLRNSAQRTIVRSILFRILRLWPILTEFECVNQVQIYDWPSPNLHRRSRRCHWDNSQKGPHTKTVSFCNFVWA